MPEAGLGTINIDELYKGREAELVRQSKRFKLLAAKHEEIFGETCVRFFSAPGRIEIAGNHTDHNHGRVIAASVDLDSIAAVSPTDKNVVTLYSEGYEEPFAIDLSELEIIDSEKGTTSALIRGIAARFKDLGCSIGGFNACMASNVLPGSGLSSSASVESLIGTIFSALFNDGFIDSQTIAAIGQYAENQYFGKPCGLMDQMACSVGGILSIDFEYPAKPVIRKIGFDFSQKNYRAVIVNTGGSHADLTEDYASVPAEMRAVAEKLGKSVCREIDFDDLLARITKLREAVGDRSVLRAIHFLNENERVREMERALDENNLESFLSKVRESGNSSFKWLQNIYSIKSVNEQGISLALALTERFLKRIGAGACRVHGGGFAGTILVFLPAENMSEYIKFMEPAFASSNFLPVDIRRFGTVEVRANFQPST